MTVRLDKPKPPLPHIIRLAEYLRKNALRPETWVRVWVNFQKIISNALLF